MFSQTNNWSTVCPSMNEMEHEIMEIFLPEEDSQTSEPESYNTYSRPRSGNIIPIVLENDVHSHQSPFRFHTISVESESNIRTRVVIQDLDTVIGINSSESQDSEFGKVIMHRGCIDFTYQKEINCTICTDDFQNGERLSILRCSHIFHANCLKRWLENYQNSCPLCRSYV